jgi:hypothetical protein
VLPPLACLGSLGPKRAGRTDLFSVVLFERKRETIRDPAGRSKEKSWGHEVGQKVRLLKVWLQVRRDRRTSACMCVWRSELCERVNQPFCFILSLYPSSIFPIVLPANCRLSCISLRERVQESRVKTPKSQDDCRPGPCLTTWSWRAVRQRALSRFTNPGRGCHARPRLPCICSVLDAVESIRTQPLQKIQSTATKSSNCLIQFQPPSEPYTRYLPKLKKRR